MDRGFDCELQQSEFGIGSWHRTGHINQVSLIMSLALLLAGFAAVVNLGLLGVDKRLHRRI